MAQQFDSLVDDEDKFGGIGGETKAFGAGAARGATFGLSDQALVHSGLVDPETLKGLQETNPVSNFAGEMTGIVAPALLGDEAGLANLPGSVAKLGRVAEGSAGLMGAGKVTAKAIGLATEGAIYGAGQSISENALGDHDLVSEKTLANIGLSSAFMGGLGIIGGKFVTSLGKDASSVEDKFLAKKMEANALPGSEEAVLAQTDMPAEDKLSFIKNFKSQKPGANGLRKEFEEAGLPEVLGMMSDNDMVQKYASAISQLPTMAGDAVRADINAGFDQVNNIIKDSFNAMPSELMDREAGGATVKQLIRDKFDQLYQPLKEAYAAREALGEKINIPEGKAYDTFNELVYQSENFRNATNPGRKVFAQAAEDFMKEVSDTNGIGAMRNLDSFSKQLSSQARAMARAGDHDSSHAFYQVRDIVDKLLDDQAPNELRKQYSSFKKTIADFAETTGLGKKATTELGINEALDKIPNEKFVDHIFDPKNAKGLDQIQKSFPDVFSALASQKKSQMYQDALINKTFNPLQLLKEISTEKKMSKGVKSLLFTPEQLAKMQTAEKWIRNLPAKVGPSGTPEGLEYLEMAKNPVKSLIGHSVNEAGSAIGKKLIESLTKPGEEARLKTLLNLDKAQEKVNKSITTKIKSLLKISSEPLLAKGVSTIVSKADFEDEAKELRENSSNPQKMMDKFAENSQMLDLHAPNVSNSMKMAYVRGTQFLNSKLPPQPPDFFGKKPEVSNAEIRKFNRYFDIVQDPLHALDQLKDRTLTPETIESLQTVYPKLYQSMKQDLINEISVFAKEDKVIPFQLKQMVSQFIGEPIDQSLSGQSIIANQATFMAPTNTQVAGGAAKVNSKGLEKLGVAGRSKIGRQDEDA